jgi:hypothetical protein
MTSTCRLFRSVGYVGLGVISALALLASCHGETQERPQSPSSARASSMPKMPPLPETAFEDPNPTSADERAGDARVLNQRFATRRIGEATPPARPYRGARIDLDLKAADIHDVFRLLADVGKVNIVVAGDVSGTVTMRLRRVPWDQALDVIARARGLSYEREGNVILVRAGGSK